MTPVEMFNLGAKAASQVGNCSQRYVCPLCRNTFFRYDKKILTKEHVPAKSVGGNILLLTCTDCNNSAGTLIQADEAERHRLVSFYEGKGSGKINLEIQTEKGILRGAASMTGSIRDFVVDVDRTHPKALVVNQEIMNEAKVYRVGRKYDWHKSRVSDLRNAYLWLFAEYGYSFVLHDFYDWVREDIQRGKSDNGKWGLRMNDPFSKQAQEKYKGPVILIVSEPQGAIIVANGEYGCLMPTIQCPNPYEKLSDEKAEISLLPRCIPVPKEMKLNWDFNPNLLRQ